MATQAQLDANRANAQHSTGAKTEEGKAASSKNRFRYGFTGGFTLLGSEDEFEYASLVLGLQEEYQPATPAEHLLVQKMAQHHWLSQRAMRLQTRYLDDEKQFALFLRYQTTNDRGFSKCLNDLLKLRAERRKAEIGFESQKLKEAAEARKQSVEKRRAELHQWAVSLAEAKVEYQQTSLAASKRAKISAPKSKKRRKKHSADLHRTPSVPFSRLLAPRPG